MQHSSDFFLEIGRFLPAGETTCVLAALRHDPLLWRSLGEDNFRRKVLEHAGCQAASWSPGRLALLTVDEQFPAEMLRAEPMPAISPALQEHALQAYQNTQRTGKPPATLREAGLLALALRERRRLTGTWSGLLQEIAARQKSSEGLFEIWRTPLACLYALIPDPAEMLRGLLPKTHQNLPFEWIISSQLCQPVSDADHEQTLMQVLQGLPVVYQLSLLRGLSLHGGEEIAAALAGHILVGHPAFSNLRMQASKQEYDLAGFASRSLALQQMGAFYQLAGDRTQALSLFNAAEVTLDQWRAGLYLQRLNLQMNQERGNTDMLVDGSQLTHLASAADWLKNDLGVVLVSHPYAGSLIEQVPGENESSFLQLKRARQMFEREPAVARDFARQGASSLLASIQQQGIPFSGDFVYTWRPEDVLGILLELDLPDEALAIAQAMSCIRPADIRLLHLTAKILERLGRLEEAMQAARFVVALDASRPEWRRLLANLLGQANLWEDACNEWHVVLSLFEKPELADRLAYAKAALRAGQLDNAIHMSEDILHEDSNHGAALGLLGQGLAARGEKSQAVGYLVRATLLAPEALDCWLTLAQVQDELGDTQRALDTLRAAATAVPEMSESHLALGQACVKTGLLAEALPHLKKAFTLSPESEKAALLYGQTLRILGHVADARAVLEHDRQAWTTCPELAFEYAQVLLDGNDPDNALPVLEMALRSGLPVLDGYLLYAKILLGEYHTGDEAWDAETVAAHMQQADQALRHILQVDPANLEARFLIADILREKGDLQAALDAYRELAESPVSETPALRWRVQWGMGRTALRLGDTETALVALKDACQAKPDSPLMQRTLAEAFLSANLPQEALQAASSTLQLEPDTIETLSWYADFATRLGEPRRAVEALERVVQLQPERTDLLVSLGSSQLSAGDLSAARATMERVRAAGNASLRDLRSAAHIYMRLEDPHAALDCFEAALTLEENPPVDLLFEAAQLQHHIGNDEAALELAQLAVNDRLENMPVQLLQADLLTRLKRPQAAMAVLERSLHVAKDAEESSTAGFEKREKISGWLGEIHKRFARLMLDAADLPAALHHAECALAMNPKDAAMCYKAASLAFALLQNDRAAGILKSFQPGAGEFPGNLLALGKDGLDLLSLHIEMSIDAGRYDEAIGWVEEALYRAPEEARLLASRARLLSHQGDLAAGNLSFEMAAAQCQEDVACWLADAALDVQRWKDALSYAERSARALPEEPRAQLTLARVLVICAERQRLCSALECVVNAPGTEFLSQNYHQRFENAVNSASRLVNTGEVGRWQVRGEAVFAPSTHSARALAAIPAQAEDTAALVAVLRQLHNRAAAVQVTRRFADHPAVLLQLALCSLDEPSRDGLAVAKKALLANPGQPLAHAALAKVARQAGEAAAALDAYENALLSWADEPAWHDAAGDLCMQLGDVENAVVHRKQALALEPSNGRHAFKLGQACLSNDDVSGAISCLENSIVLEPEQAGAWLTLASTYRMAGRLPQALEAARKASELDSTSAEGLLIAGEAALSMGLSDQALEFAQGAVRRAPENAGALLSLSNVLVQQGRLADGLAVLDEASPAARAIFPVAFERGKLIGRLHGPQAAVEVLERLAKDFPEEPGLLSFLACTQVETGELKSAEQYALRALRLDPNQPDLTLMLGRLHRKNGQLDQAVHMLTEAIHMAPEELDGYLELASVYQQRREFAQALQIYQQAIRIAPTDHQAFYQSGLILRDSKDYSPAEDMLRRAAELAPDNLTIRRQLVAVIALNLVHRKQEVNSA